MVDFFFSLQVSHHKQYPSGTTTVFSYFECRGGKFPEVCFFGLQYLLKVYIGRNLVTFGFTFDITVLQFNLISFFTPVLSFHSVLS